MFKNGLAGSGARWLEVLACGRLRGSVAGARSGFVLFEMSLPRALASEAASSSELRCFRLGA